MDFDVIFLFLGEHLGEIILGIELFLLNVFGKGKTKEQLADVKKKALDKKKTKLYKKITACQTAMSNIEEEEKTLEVGDGC